MKRFVKVFTLSFWVSFLFALPSVFAQTLLQDGFAEIRYVFTQPNSPVAQGIGIFLLVLLFYALYFVATSKIKVFESAKPARVVVSAVLAIFSTYGITQALASSAPTSKLALEIIGLLFVALIILFIVFLFSLVSKQEFNFVLKFILYVLIVLFAYMAFMTVGGGIDDKIASTDGSGSIFSSIFSFMESLTWLSFLFAGILFIVFVVAPIVLLFYGASKLFGTFSREKENSDATRVRRAIQEVDEESAKVDAMLNGMFNFIRDKERQLSRSQYTNVQVNNDNSRERREY